VKGGERERERREELAWQLPKSPPRKKFSSFAPI
jgi:hypothetical protein